MSYVCMYLYIVLLQWATVKGVYPINVLEAVSAIHISTKSQWPRFPQCVVRCPNPNLEMQEVIFLRAQKTY